MSQEIKRSDVIEYIKENIWELEEIIVKSSEEHVSENCNYSEINNLNCENNNILMMYLLAKKLLESW